MAAPLTEEQYAELEVTFLAAMPPHGTVGNMTLREKLGWPEDRYNDVKARLLATDTIATGRGRGGSVRLPANAESGDHDAQT